METLAVTLCIIVFVVSNIIFMPIEIYYTVSLYKRKDSLIISKRKPGLIVIGVALSTIFFFWNMTYTIIVFSLYQTLYRTHWWIVVFIPIGMTAWYIYIVRVWLVFYQIKFNVETIALKWQTIIDPTNSSKAFYHLYKHLIGTWKATSIILIIYEVMVICIMIIMLIINDYNPISRADNKWFTAQFIIHWIFSFIALYIPLIVLICISCKTPSHYDNIGLSKEVRFTSYCFLVIVMTWCIIDIIILVYAETEEVYTWDFLYLSTVILWRIVFFIACMIQTRFPMKKFGPILDRYSTSTAVKLTHSATLEELKTINMDSTAEHTETMKQVLSNDESFDLFVKHCSNEHCLECILSVVEFIQYKCKLYEIIINDENLDNDCIENDTEKYLILPDTVPQSMVCYNDEMDNKLIARVLYLKYIKVNSPFEINLSYTDRKKFSRLMENKSHWLNEKKYNSEIKLFSLFDHCIMEMCQLLRAAFSRYTKSNQYIILKRHSMAEKNSVFKSKSHS